MAVIRAPLQKLGNDYVVTVPVSEVTRLGLNVGQMLRVRAEPVEQAPVLRPELREAFERSLAEHEAIYRALGDD